MLATVTSAREHQNTGDELLSMIIIIKIIIPVIVL